MTGMSSLCPLGNVINPFGPIGSSILEPDSEQPTGLEKMVEKAKVMLKTGRVTRIDRSTYQVVGDHGIYIVVKGVDGNYHCGCQGYMTRGFCSHALSINMLEERAKSRRRQLVSPKQEEASSQSIESVETEEIKSEEESEETQNTDDV